MRINSSDWDFINARLLAGKEIIAENNLLFDRIKYLALPEPVIDKSIEQPSEKRFKIRLRSRTFVKGCTLSFGQWETELSDNCFDLVPAEVKTVICQTARKTALKSFNNKMKVRWVRSLKTCSL